MTDPTFLIANLWHDDNRGDAAITIGTGMLLRSRFPRCRLRLAPMRQSDDGVRHVSRGVPGATVVAPLVPEMPPTATMRDRLLLIGWAVRVLVTGLAVGLGHVPRRLRRSFDGVDVVVLVGGSNLFDTGTGWGLSSVRLLQLLLPGYAGVALGRPVWVLGHTLGPFRSRLGRRLAARLLRDASRVVLREDLSSPVALALGAEDPVVTADMAFAIEPDHSERVQRVLWSHHLTEGQFAVLTVRRAPYGSIGDDEVMIEELADVIAALLRERLVRKVAIVVHTSGPTDIENDRAISVQLGMAARCRAGVHADEVVIVDDDLSPAEMAAFYGEARLLIGERLHSVILALRAGTPSFAISYFSAKAPGIMAACGFPDRHCGIAEVRADQLLDVARELCRPEARDEVRERVGALSDRLRGVV